ncbi:hypothetical protein PG997_001054 [Apiospora hydei]|uniref:Uncharacterized protein n=1 Tax=Apiospora hydei TaxID=1337664 RepID=A0ABR1XCP8_9PEZI
MHRTPTQHNRGRSGSFAPLAQDEPDLQHENGHETEVEADEEVHSGRHRLSGRARFQQQTNFMNPFNTITNTRRPLPHPRLIRGSYGSPPEEFQEIDIAELEATQIEYYGPRAPSSLSKESDAPTESTFVDDKDKFFCCAYETPIVGVDEKSDPPVTNRPAQGFADYRPFVLKSHFSLLLLLMLGALLGLTVYSTHILPTENQLLVPPNSSNSRNDSMSGLKLRGLVPVRVFGRASVAVKLGRAEQDGNATQPEEQPQGPTTPTLVPTHPVGGTSAQTHPSPGEGHTTTDDSPGKLPPPYPTSPEIQTSPTDGDGGGGVSTPPVSPTTSEPPKDKPPKPTTAEATSPTAKPTTTEATSPTEAPPPTAPSPTEAPSLTEVSSTTDKPTTIEMTSPTEATIPTETPGTTEAPLPTGDPTTAKLTSPTTEPSPTGVPSPTETSPPPPPPPPPTGAPGGQKPGIVCTDTVVLTITKTTTLSETTVYARDLSGLGEGFDVHGPEPPGLGDIFGRGLGGRGKRLAVPVTTLLPRQVPDCTSTVTTTITTEVTVIAQKTVTTTRPPTNTGGGTPKETDNAGSPVITPTQFPGHHFPDPNGGNGSPKTTDNPDPTNKTPGPTTVFTTGDGNPKSPGTGDQVSTTKPGAGDGQPKDTDRTTPQFKLQTPPVQTPKPTPNTDPPIQTPSPKPNPPAPTPTPDLGTPAHPPTPNPDAPAKTPAAKPDVPPASSTSPIDRPSPLSPRPSATPPASQALQVGNASPLEKQPTPLATSDPDEVPPLVLGVVSTPPDGRQHSAAVPAAAKA